MKGIGRFIDTIQKFCCSFCIKRLEYIKWKDLQCQIPLRTDDSKKQQQQEILSEKRLCPRHCTYIYGDIRLYFQIMFNWVDMTTLICMKISEFAAIRENSLNLSQKKTLQLAGVWQILRNSSINHLVRRVFIKYKKACILSERPCVSGGSKHCRGQRDLNWTRCEKEIKLSGIICFCSRVWPVLITKNTASLIFFF